MASALNLLVPRFSFHLAKHFISHLTKKKNLILGTSSSWDSCALPSSLSALEILVKVTMKNTSLTTTLEEGYVYVPNTKEGLSLWNCPT